MSIPPFKPKIGQLVYWAIHLNGIVGAPSTTVDHLGMITDVVSDTYVEVTFLQQDWIIRLAIEALVLVSDVE